MIAHGFGSEICHDGRSGLWTRLHCSRCRYASEHPGSVTPGDLDRCCGLCGAPLGAVTVYRIGETVGSVLDEASPASRVALYAPTRFAEVEE